MVPLFRHALRVAGERTGVRVLKWAILTEHVHLLVSMSPGSRLSDFVRHAKTVSAFSSNKASAGALKWCRGCFADSVSHRHLRYVQNYIARQHRHHPDRIPS
jgi:REP element-mobilizing transposase RayT